MYWLKAALNLGRLIHSEAALTAIFSTQQQLDDVMLIID